MNPDDEGPSNNSAQPNSIKQPEIPPQDKMPMNWRGTSVIIIAVVVVILAAFSGFLFLTGRQPSSQKAKTTVPSSEAIPSPVNAAPATPNTSSTPTIPGWKTYINPTYRYSINYPPDWNMSELPTREVPPVVFSSPNIETKLNGTITGGGEVTIFISDNSSNKTLAELLGNPADPASDFIERKLITINKLQALRYVAWSEGIDDTVTGIVLIANGKLYTIEANYGLKDKEVILRVFEQMINSLSFLT